VGAAFFEKKQNLRKRGGAAGPRRELGGLPGHAESTASPARLISAQWDPWQDLQQHQDDLAKTDIYCCAALSLQTAASSGREMKPTVLIKVGNYELRHHWLRIDREETPERNARRSRLIVACDTNLARPRNW